MAPSCLIRVINGPVEVRYRPLQAGCRCYKCNLFAFCPPPIELVPLSPPPPPPKGPDISLNHQISWGEAQAINFLPSNSLPAVERAF